MELHPQAFGNYLCALDFCLARVYEIAMPGDPQDAAIQTLLSEVSGRYLPNSVVACGLVSSPRLLAGKMPVGGRPTAYVCRDNVCEAPVTDPVALGRLLDEPRSHER
jgi:uncharacterized protein YyaL (SSP411 family)